MKKVRCLDITYVCDRCGQGFVERSACAKHESNHRVIGETVSAYICVKECVLSEFTQSAKVVGEIIRLEKTLDGCRGAWATMEVTDGEFKGKKITASDDRFERILR